MIKVYRYNNPDHITVKPPVQNTVNTRQIQNIMDRLMIEDYKYFPLQQDTVTQ